jgi:hypothetical protein
MSDTAFYIRKEDLTDLVNYFENQRPAHVGEKPLRGFVVRKGMKGGEAALFPEPVYSDQQNPTGEDPKVDIIVPNEDRAAGCPYPPGYKK